MDNKKIQIDEFDVARYQVIKKALEDQSKLSNEIKGGLAGITSYLDSIMKKGNNLNESEAKLVESLTKRMQLMGEYNRLLEKCGKTHGEIAEDFEELLALQSKLNEQLKTSKNEAIKFSDYSSKAQEYLRSLGIEDNKTKIKDVAAVFEKLVKLSSSVTKELVAANIELERTNSSLATWNKRMSEGSRLANNIKQTFGIIKRTVADVTENWRKFNDITAKTSRNMGINLDNLRAFQTTMMRNVASFGVQYGLAYDDLVKFQQKYSEVTQRNTIINRENAESMSAMHVLVGDEAMFSAVNEFDKLGGGIQTATSYLMKQYDVATKLGLNANQAVNIMNKNLSMANKYSFKDGVNGFQRMALLSQQLRMNMESVGAVIDKSSSLEGSIDMAASMQVLGGSYAAQFGNPLQILYESLNDAEGMANRVINTFADKGNFNYKTGMVDISAFNKAMMREAAKNMGYSFEEALNIANRTGVRRESMRYMSDRLSKEEKDLLANLAQYNVERQRFEVTYFGADNMEHTVDIGNINPSDIKYIKNNIIDESLDTNVKNIYSLLRERFGHKARSLVSMNENIAGAKTTMSAMRGMAEDGVMKSIDGTVKSGAKFVGGLSEGWQKGIGIVRDFVSIAAGLGGLGYIGWNEYMRRKGMSAALGNSSAPLGGINPGGVYGSSGGGNVAPAAVPSSRTGAREYIGPDGKKYKLYKNGNLSVDGQKYKPGSRGYKSNLQAYARASNPGQTATQIAQTSSAQTGAMSRIIGRVGPKVASGVGAGVLSGVWTGLEEFGGANNHTTGQKVAITAGSTLGGAAGAMLGTIAGPAGAMIGGMLGSALGSKLGSVLSGANKADGVKPHPLDNGTAGPMFSGDINVHVNGTIKIKYPDGASQELAKELQKPEIRQAIKNIVVSELAKANAHGGTIDMGSQQMQINGVGLT